METTNIDVAEKIAAFLEKRTREFKEKGKEKQASEAIGTLESGDHGMQIIAHPNFRADRILLPKLVSDITGFTEIDELVMKIEKGKVTIERL